MGQFTHLPYARTSHLRTLSKILGSGLSTCCRGAPTFVEASRPVYRGFCFRQHLSVSIPAFPRCSGPEAFPSGEPHMLARFRRTSTPCEALFSSSSARSCRLAPTAPWRGAHCARGARVWEGGSSNFSSSRRH